LAALAVLAAMFFPQPVERVAKTITAQPVLSGGMGLLTVLVIPLALICGPIRGIPWGWQLLDCSFGLLGVVPLLVVRRMIRKLERPSPAC
jgi:hypothetical protein